MKILKIEPNGNALYLKGDGTWASIIEIDKDDTLRLLDLCISHNVEIDKFDSEKIKNPAQNIIYKSIYIKFTEFIDGKQGFLDEVDGLYKDALSKYS
ncbi:hypothetical protein [Vibrio alginolyticus]